MRLEHLRTYLQDAGVTWPIFGQIMPPDPARAVAIRGYSGQPGRMLQDNLLPIDDYPRFQIMTRGPDDVETEDKARELHDLLHVRLSNVGGAYALRLQAEQMPVFMSRDESGRYVYVFNCSSWVLR